MTFVEIGELLGQYLPNALAAIAVLVVGWVAALVIASGVRALIKRTQVGKHLAALDGEKEAQPMEIEHWASRAVYYLVMFFVLVAFFEVLGLTLIAAPLTYFLNEVFQYAPRLFGSAILLFAAWAAASVVKFALWRLLRAGKVDERLAEGAGVEDKTEFPLSRSFSNAIYWVVWLLFLPAVLTALGLEGVLRPVQDMVTKALDFLPNIAAAILILTAGWFGARILQRFVMSLLGALGVDRLTKEAGLDAVLGQRQLSHLVGLILYAFVLLFALVAALNALALEAITAPASEMLAIILQAVPALLAAALVLFVAYGVGRIVMGLVTNLLKGIGFDKILFGLGLGREAAPGRRSISEIGGYLVLVAIMLFAAIEASRLLGFVVLGDMIAQFTVFLWQVVLAVVVFAIGLYLARLAGEVVEASGTPQSNLLAKFTRAAILVLAGGMALQQLGIASELILLTFGLLLGALVLAAAIAFGVGGREIAARELERWVDNFKNNS